MVLIWDGQEGGGHNTWDYVYVTDHDQPGAPGVSGPKNEHPERASAEDATRTGTSEARESPPWAVLAGVGVGGLVLGFVGGRAAARRRP